jgi:uncharacterized protein (TIGR02266 family)
MLSEALGGLQDIQTPGLDIQDLTGSIAKAVGALYAVQFSDPTDPAHVAGVQNAMGCLSQTLAMLQDVQTTEPAVQNTSRTLARVLAILYPVSKAQEQVAQQQPPQQAVAPATAAAAPQQQPVQQQPPQQPVQQQPPQQPVQQQPPQQQPQAQPAQPMQPSQPPPQIDHHPDRNASRHACEVDIGFQSDTNFYAGFSEDISEGGLFVSTYDFKTIGSEIDVNFTLPSGHTVMAQGVVRWIRELNPLHPDQLPGMGVQFTNLTEIDKKAIQEFLGLRTPMFYDA